MEINIYAISIWISAILIAGLAFVVFVGSKMIFVRFFAGTILIIALLSSSIAYYLFTPDLNQAKFGINLTFLLGIVTIVSMLLSFISLKNEKLPNIKYLISSILFLSGYGYLIFNTNLIIGEPVRLQDSSIGINWVWSYGPLAIVHILLIFIIWISSIFVLLNIRKNISDNLQKKYISYILTGFIIGGLSMWFFNLVTTIFNTFDYTWIGPTTSLLWVPIMGLGILKLNKMNIRLIATESFAISVIIIGFINIFLDFL